MPVTFDRLDMNELTHPVPVDNRDQKKYTDGFIDSIHSYPLYEGFKHAFIPDSTPTLNMQSFLNKLDEQQYWIKVSETFGPW
jgi:hypothetical protein